MQKYSLQMRLFHWSMGLIVIAILISGFVMKAMEKSELKWEIYGLHKSFGVVILIIFLPRLLLRLQSHIPALPEDITKLERKFSTLGHYTLYLLMLLLPLSGYLGSNAWGYDVVAFGNKMPKLIDKNEALGPIFSFIHHNAPWVLIALLIIHVGAVLKHVIFDKVNLLKRIV